MKQHLGVALVGCGTVGGAVAMLITEQQESIAKRTGVQLELHYVVDKNLDYARKLGLNESILVDDYTKALNDPKVGVIIELVGGTTFAKEFVLQSLKAGKHVVTANKALLAYHGRELFDTALENGVSIGFEASCGGGIPLIRALYDGLAGNTIDAIYGIVNGTCNYILSEMIQKDKSYEEALADAQSAGFAEADPTLDISGGDSAHKICIMAGLAFGTTMSLEKIPVQGINTLETEDVLFGSEMGYVMKLIASAVRGRKGIFVRVEPAFIPMDHPLAWVNGSFNAVSIYGDSVGHTMYYGRGAGGTPTASAVVGDLISLGLGAYPLQFQSLAQWPRDNGNIRIQEPGDIRRRYYVKLRVLDRPGNLGKITTILGSKTISVSSILQHEIPEPEEANTISPIAAEIMQEPCVPIVITTHRIKEAHLVAAIKEIEAMEDIQGGVSIIPILDEHPEFRVF